MRAIESIGEKESDRKWRENINHTVRLEDEAEYLSESLEL